MTKQEFAQWLVKTFSDSDRDKLLRWYAQNGKKYTFEQIINAYNQVVDYVETYDAIDSLSVLDLNTWDIIE